MTLVSFDIGRTRCRAMDHEAGARSTLPLLVGKTLADADGPPALAAMIRRFLHDHTSVPQRPVAVVVAVAGALGRPAAVTELTDLLCRPPVVKAVVTGDVVAAHAAAHQGAPGVVLSAGTGAVALGVDIAGKHRLVGGDGYLLGDAGGGFAVGRAGLAAAVRYYDGRPGGSATLARAAEHRFGAVRALPGMVHADPDGPRLVASFATDTADAARAGDPVADRIWGEVVVELAHMVSAACEGLPTGDRQVALMGGLCSVSDLVVVPLRETLAEMCPGVVVQEAPPDAHDGAALLSRPPAGIYEALLVRAPGHRST